MRKALLLLPLVGALALAAGCGSSKGATSGSSETPPPTSAPATVTDTVVPPTTTATATQTATPTGTQTATPSGPRPCATTNLTVTLGAGEGAGGSTYFPLRFANKGAASCTLAGYPGVSYVAPGNGVQVGPAAGRTAPAGRTVTLAPHADATAVVQAVNPLNFDRRVCAPTPVAGFRVYPPDNRTAAFVALPSASQACSREVPGVGSLLVRAVVAGSTGQ